MSRFKLGCISPEPWFKILQWSAGQETKVNWMTRSVVHSILERTCADWPWRRVTGRDAGQCKGLKSNNLLCGASVKLMPLVIGHRDATSPGIQRLYKAIYIQCRGYVFFFFFINNFLMYSYCQETRPLVNVVTEQWLTPVVSQNSKDRQTASKRRCANVSSHPEVVYKQMTYIIKYYRIITYM